MEGTSSELVGGDHNDQTVQPSAEEIRKEKRRRRDNRRKEREQREIESTRRELEKMKADYAKLEKNHAYLRGKLEQLEHDVEQTRETRRRLEQIVEQQNIMINMLQIYIYLLLMMRHSLPRQGLPVPQGWAHENNSEQPGSTYGDQFCNFNGCSSNDG
ncbi:hypothetical protein BDE02_14G009000 [Populus trichocarpa]|nr:hypothetical protein BDE02_14G009000 [Populus trichocarpa]